MLILAIDVVGTGDDAFLEAAEVIAPCAVAAVGVEVVRSADEFVRARFSGHDDVFVAIGPGHFAVAPEALGVVEGDRAFRFAKFTGAQKEQGTYREKAAGHFHRNYQPNLRSLAVICHRCSAPHFT